GRGGPAAPRGGPPPGPDRDLLPGPAVRRGGGGARDTRGHGQEPRVLRASRAAARAGRDGVGSLIPEECRRRRELLGAYLLGHLGPEERVGLEAHLDGCAECRAELADLRPVAGALAFADPAPLRAP